MPSIEVILTKHTKEKMVLLGITKEQVKVALERGAKTKQTEGYLASFTYLKVAYKKIGENCYKVKTVFIA